MAWARSRQRRLRVYTDELETSDRKTIFDALISLLRSRIVGTEALSSDSQMLPSGQWTF